MALTSAHTSGTKDMRLYGAVELTISDEPMTRLTLGDAALQIGLAEAGATFAAAIDGDKLTLTTDSDSDWTLNGSALKTLMRSGVCTLALENGSKRVELSTEPALTGGIYARLCAEGYVSSDYDYRIGGEEILVTVSGSAYRLSDAGELIPTEGD